MPAPPAIKELPAFFQFRLGADPSSQASQQPFPRTSGASITGPTALLRLYCSRYFLPFFTGTFFLAVFFFAVAIWHTPISLPCVRHGALELGPIYARRYYSLGNFAQFRVHWRRLQAPRPMLFVRQSGQTHVAEQWDAALSLVGARTAEARRFSEPASPAAVDRRSNRVGVRPPAP